jgi:glycosyltransferase involved in cell wall biosynthesis
MIRYTIAICTRNRAALLDRTLRALLREVPADHSEILVVDNASTDSTAQVAQSHLVRYRCEPTLGIAHVRNHAAREALGEWLIYVDDDAVVQPGWFGAIQTAITTRTPSPFCVLGRVQLEWEGYPAGARAAWFPPEFFTLLSEYDRGETGHFLAKGDYLLTTNTAIHRQTLLGLGGFRTELGHRGKSLLGGEDNDLFDKLVAAKHPIWYEPNALALHWVPRERQTRRFLIRRVFWDGATQPLMDYGINQPRNRYLREMGRDLRRVGRITLDRWRDLFNGRIGLLGLEWIRQIGRFYMNSQLWRGRHG